MSNKKIRWIVDYLEKYKSAINDSQVYPDLLAMKEIFDLCNAKDGKVILAGNGGSAAIASHCAVDFTKNARIRATNFNEADLITCLANDYGYEKWLAKAINFYADKGDIIVLISSSGRSKNILIAADEANQLGLDVVTFSGFDSNNSLRSKGKINFWVNSRAYNVVEMTHHIWLLTVVDMIIGSAEYSA